MMAVFGMFSPQKTNRRSLRKNYPKNFGRNCWKNLNLNLKTKTKTRMRTRMRIRTRTRMRMRMRTRIRMRMRTRTTEAKTSQMGQWCCRLKALTQHTKPEKSNTAVSTSPSIPLSNAEFSIAILLAQSL